MESLGQSVIDGVADWLSRLIDGLPDLVPRRGDPTAEVAAAAWWLRRFVHEVVTTDPATKQTLANIQVFLIEAALDCVDWEGLARDPRFAQLDRSEARLTSP